MKLFIPCRPEDVRIHAHGQGVEVRLRPAFEAKWPGEIALLIAEDPDEEAAIATLHMELEDALPSFQFTPGRDANSQMVIIDIYQPAQ